MGGSSEDLEEAKGEGKEHLGSKGLEGSKGLAGIEVGQWEGHSWKGSLDGRDVEEWDCSGVRGPGRRKALQSKVAEESVELEESRSQSGGSSVPPNPSVVGFD